MIAAAVRSNTKLNLWDCDSETLNGIVADEVLKAGVVFHHLAISNSVNLLRMIGMAE